MELMNLLRGAGYLKIELVGIAFDRRLMRRFRGSVVTSDAGLFAYRELDDTLDLATRGGDARRRAHGDILRLIAELRPPPDPAPV